MSPVWLQIYHCLLAHWGPQHWWPGETPFEVMVGAILTQNTAWTNVERAMANLRAAEALDGVTMGELSDAALADLIRPAGCFNVKAHRLRALCAYLGQEAVLDNPGDLASRAGLPELRRRLLAVPGIGEESADAILLYALGLPSFVVDAYTRRIFRRLGLLADGMSYDAIQSLFHNHLPRDPQLYNEYHALIVQLGKTSCRPQPRCATCPLENRCPRNLI